MGKKFLVFFFSFLEFSHLTSPSHRSRSPLPPHPPVLKDDYPPPRFHRPPVFNAYKTPYVSPIHPNASDGIVEGLNSQNRLPEDPRKQPASLLYRID